MASVTETLELAVRHHRAGRLEDAEQLYREIVRLDPRHADALHLLGIASHQRNENRAAVDYISRAIAVDDSSAVFHSNLGAAYQALGDSDAAIECFQEALRIAPGYVDAWHNLAAVLHTAGKHEASAGAYRELLRLCAGDARYRVALGAVLRDAGRTEEAVEQYRLAIEAQPDFVEAHFALGLALRSLARDAEAADCFKAVIALQPRHARAHNNLGGILHDRGAVVPALECYVRALAVDPGYADAHCNLATAQRALGRVEDAVESYRRAIALRPDFADAWFNLGNLYRGEARMEQAAESYRRTLAISPDHFRARVNLAVTLKDQRKFDEALEQYERVLEIDGELPEARFNRSLVWLTRGDFARGWDEYEWRRRHDPQPPRFHVPEWDGSNRDGGRLLVTSEQGIGDQIMFASCLPELLASGMRCVVECDRRLVPLFQRSFPGAAFFGKDDSRNSAELLADVGRQVPCGSLPRFFRRDPAAFPRRRAFLQPDARRCADWAARLNELGGGLKVGVSWFGGKDDETRRRRSTPLECWRGVLAVGGVQFVNLQYGDVSTMLRDVEREFGVTIHAWEGIDPLRELDDFCSLVASLDLVISVDNSTVHLAGALGTPVWTLLPFESDWRWLLERVDSPWYPGMRLFRQQSRGDWREVFEQVADRLKNGAALEGIGRNESCARSRRENPPPGVR